MGILLLFASQQSAANQKAGAGVMVGASSGSNAIVYVESGKGVAVGRGSGGQSNTGAGLGAYPTLSYQVAFSSQPLSTTPNWVELGSRVRGLSIKRGRSYEFDRMETGTMGAALSNRDAALSPANSGSPYAPIKSTRAVRASLTYDQSYPLFRGISEGFPQAFPNVGKDALVQFNASDLFYALNQVRFSPGSTTITSPLSAVLADTTHSISVASTVLPMPQVPPFDITIDSEIMTVTAILSATQYTVFRTMVGTAAHSSGAAVTTDVVSFSAALSGTRIQQVLEAVGFSAPWYDLDTGQTIMAASPNLVSTNPLEHINLITDAEFGRFFVSKDGRFTFRDRHSIILDFLNPVATFRNLPVSGSEIPFRIDDVLEHSEDKLFNRVRITIPSGQVVDVSDQASIDDHFERVFQREWPYASVNDAEAAAQFVLGRSIEHALRLPSLIINPVINSTVLWPLVLAREIGDRVRFRYQPEGGGTEIDQEMIVEGIGHTIAPQNMSVSVQLTEADPNEYWILGLAGYGELGQTTWVGF